MNTTLTAPGDLTTVVDDYLAAALAGDRQTAVGVALAALAAGASPESVITHVLAAAQARIGEGWQSGMWSVAQEHRASAITEAALQAVSDAAMRTPGAVVEGSAGQAIVACSEGEWHVLPGRMASEILRLRGCGVSFIGPSIPADMLVEMFEFDPPAAVAVTCSMPLSLMGSWATASALRELGMTVICGGRGFGPDGLWARQVGADIWGPTFEDGADALIEALGHPRPAPRPPVGEPETIAEVQAVRRDGPSMVETAMAISLEAWPWLNESGNTVRSTRADLQATLQAAGSAMLVGDATLLTDYIEWFESVLSARDLPVEFVATAFDLLLAVVPESLPRLRAMVSLGLAACSKAPMARATPRDRAG